MKKVAEAASAYQFTDQDYLTASQYRDARNLQARIGLHERFSTNPYGWHRWVFDRLDLPPEARILELGAGPGRLWAENRDSIPSGWSLILTDLSSGMAREARANLSGLLQAHFLVADAQALPFAGAAFDAVIANHMLYHVPTRERAYAEIRRVLSPGGRFYAATNGDAHMRELYTLERGLDLATSPAGSGFTLETGGAELARWFSGVTLARYPDGLVVTEAEPLVAYVASWHRGLPVATLAEFRRLTEAALADGPIRITKDTGLFVAAV